MISQIKEQQSSFLLKNPQERPSQSHLLSQSQPQLVAVISLIRNLPILNFTLHHMSEVSILLLTDQGIENVIDIQFSISPFSVGIVHPGIPDRSAYKIRIHIQIIQSV